MASSYSTNLKIELIGVGEQTDQWGSTTNNNFQYALEEAITGYAQATFPSDADYDWAATYVNTNTAQAPRNLVIEVLGTLSATRNLVVPTIEKQYIIYNATTGGQSIVVKTSAGTGITVPNGVRAHLFVNGTDVVSMVTYMPSLSLGTALPLASGGTGQTTANAALNALLPAQTSNNGKYLTTDGTNTSWATVSAGVTSFSAGTTGFTPNTGTTGAVTLAGTLAVANGGTGQTTQQAAINSLAGAVTSGQYLRGNGTNVVMSAIQVADVPTLNQNTTGSAATATNIAGGAANRIPYNTGAGATSFIAAPTVSSFLQWTGSAFAWATSSATPAGSNTQIQYNNSGAFGASSNLTWDNTNKILSVNGIRIARGGQDLINNTVVGYNAFNSNTDLSSAPNTAIGYIALEKCNGGANNVAVGGSTLANTVSGGGNTAVGQRALEYNLSSDNTAIGFDSMSTASTGSDNTAVGRTALWQSAGNKNTALGRNGGSNLTSGDNNIFIGYSAQPSAASVSNEATIGDTNITKFRIPGISLTAGAKWINVGESTVAALPAAATAGSGARAFVTDANATTFAAIVAGGGSNKVPVYSDGTNWRIG